MTAPYTLAVCSEMVFLNLPHLERVQRIHDLGFAVEIWGWPDKDPAALTATGATFTSMTGYVTGRLADADGADELLRTAEQSIPFARAIGNPVMNLHGTGLGEGGLPVVPSHEVSGAMWIQAYKTLCRVAALGEREGVVFVLENLNLAVDHPGVPFARAEDTLTLVEAVGSASLRMNLDLYHAQIGEGNLVELIRRSGDLLGEVQVADVPGRCEPGTGEVNYAATARALAEIGYSGTVAMEAFASGDSEVALDRFGQAFTL